ncbi:MAG: nitroreductase [Candidatus Sericytochromatia bacterium]|nr:nitroreductase [Candidatus Sericytochromatia bacterium]
MHSAQDAQIVLNILQARHSKRAYLPDPVPEALLAEILQAAAHAPSSKNTQPWQVDVLLNAQVKAFSQQLCEAFDRDQPEAPDYDYFPDPWPEGFLDRARACGFGLFELKGIGRKDFEARRAHNRENMTLFGAPAYLLFHLPRPAERGMFLDLGFFLQNVMLGLVAHGLASCPQFSVAGYPDLIRSFLNKPERLIVCGLAVGYPDPEAQVNTYVPERLPLEAYVTWHR